MSLTPQQQEAIANKEAYIKEKAKLVAKRKSLAQALIEAESDMEEGLIKEEREALAIKIKQLAATLREIESWEQLA